MIMDKDLVHLCCYASQPDLQIHCNEEWTTPGWGPIADTIISEGVYRADNNMLYTFEKEKVTCVTCVIKK